MTSHQVSGRKAAFFDRDGTLMEEVHYCGDPAKVKVFPNVPEALRALKQAGFLNIIVSNQAGIGRGLFTEEQYHAVQRELLRQIGEELMVEVKQHIAECHHCHVVLDTTKQTIEVYRDNEIYEFTPELQSRIHTAIMTKCRAVAK